MSSFSTFPLPFGQGGCFATATLLNRSAGAATRGTGGQSLEAIFTARFSTLGSRLVSMKELHDLIAAFATIGAIDGGGVCRLAATPADKTARDLFLREIEGCGMDTRIDAIGNMFGVAMLAPSSQETIIVGSHLDTQPTGGRWTMAHARPGRSRWSDCRPESFPGRPRRPGRGCPPAAAIP